SETGQETRPTEPASLLPDDSCLAPDFRGQWDSLPVPSGAAMIRELPKPASAPSDRLVSLDAYRGFTMFLMASAGLALTEVAKGAENPPSAPIWKAIGDQTEHTTWVGCTLWDMIQPSFMFIVGVSMVFSSAARKTKGQSFPRQLLHAIKRAALLC